MTVDQRAVSSNASHFSTTLQIGTADLVTTCRATDEHSTRAFDPKREQTVRICTVASLFEQS